MYILVIHITGQSDRFLCVQNQEREEILRQTQSDFTAYKDKHSHSNKEVTCFIWLLYSLQLLQCFCQLWWYNGWKVGFAIKTSVGKTCYTHKCLCYQTVLAKERWCLTVAGRCPLHWPCVTDVMVKQRVDYKLATLVYKSLWGQAPSYPVDDCQLIADSGRPQLRSTHANVLTVLRTNTRLGNRSFSVTGPTIWNSLPASLQQPDIEFGHFKRLLKAFLFGEIAAH